MVCKLEKAQVTVSVNHHRLTYMVTFISNYVAAIIALGLIFNKMHLYAISLII